MSDYENRLHVGQVLGGRYRMVSDGEALDVGLEYRAYDMQLDRLAVVTILDRRFGGDAESVDRLAEAQQAVADLNQPALPPVEEMGIVDGQLYLVRGPLDENPLASLLARSGPLDIRTVLQISIDLCQALAPLHRVHLVHGGLSPSSVFVGDDVQVTVFDTAVFPALEQDGAVPGQPWGRLPYISPEQAAGEGIHAASDVYVIGLLMYEMLAGRPPFRRGDAAMTALQHMRYDPPSLQVLVPDIPQSLAQVVHTALAKEPSARYRNAGQMAHLLSSQLSMLTASEPLRPVAPPYSSPSGPMVVPPPPPVDAPLAPGSYWQEETDGVDWVMIALLAAALLMVLGLIPLWRTVYRRYAIPSPPSTSRFYHQMQPAISQFLPDEAGVGWWVLEPAELEVDRFMCYNPTVLARSVTRAPRGNLEHPRIAACIDGFSGLESSLRCWG